MAERRAGTVPLGVLALVLALALAIAPKAAADGDPASDILIADNVFLSLQPPTESQQGRELEALTKAAKRQRFPLKVAVIAKRSDLGTAEALFGRAQAYADFLGQEIHFGYAGTLVVVMGGVPGGVGVYGPGKVPAVETAAASTAVPPHASLPQLADAAVNAVRRISAAAGHPLKNVHVAGGGGGSGVRDRGIIIGVAIALAALVAIFWPRRRRPAAAEADD